jgi:hypothetical protein
MFGFYFQALCQVQRLKRPLTTIADHEMKEAFRRHNP